MTVLPLLLGLVLLFPAVLLSPAYGSGEWQTSYVVSDFVDSGPPEPHQIFKIKYRVLNGTVEQFSMPFVSYAHQVHARVDSNGNGTLEVWFPKNYPSGNDDIGGEAVIFLDRQEVLATDPGTSGCYYEFSVPFAGSSEVDIVWTDSLTGKPFHGLDVSKSCVSETLIQDVVKAKDGNIAPLHQLKAGVKPEEVVCGSGFDLVMHAGKPYCVTPSTAKILKERWSA